MRKIIRDGAARRRAAMLLGAGMLACPAMTRAATATWTGGDSTYGTFTQPNNWGGALPANNGSAGLVFGSANPHGYSPTLNGNFDANSLTFNSSALSYTIVTNGSGFSGVLSLEGGGLTDNASNSESITGSTAVLVNANQTWNIAGGRFVDSTPLNFSSNTLTVNTSATGSASFTGTLSAISGASSLVKTGAGMLNLNASGSLLGNLSLQAGTTQLSGGDLSLSPAAGAAITVTGAANFNITGGATAGMYAFTTGAAGLIVDGGSTVAVTGAGSQLIATNNSPAILVGSNTTGTIAVSAGAFLNATTLYLGAGVGSTGTATVDGSSTLNLNVLFVGALVNSTGSLTITNGGTVDVANPSYFGSNSSSISISTGGGSLNTAGVSSDTPGLGSISLTDPTGGYALNINGSSGTNTYSGSISGSGSLNKSGGSTQILSGSDTFSGKVLVTGGTLALGSGNLFSQLTIGTGGTLELNPSGGLSSSVPINFDGGTFAYNASNATLANPINLTANGGTVNVSSGITLTTTGILNGPTGTLTKTGPGTLNLALSNSSSNVVWALQMNAGLTQISSGSLTIDSLSTTGGIGLNGTTFNISGGAAVTETGFNFTELTNGTVNVTGAGSSLTAYILRLGTFNPATVNLSQGGSLFSSAKVVVGVTDSGTLNVQSGSNVTIPALAVAFFPGATGTATFNGSGTSLTASSLQDGGDSVNDLGGTGTVIISNGASANISGGAFVDSPTSSINISGGSLIAGSVSNPNGGGAILLADPSNGFALNINGSSGTKTYSGSISGTGSLNKSGGSTQILSGTDTFTGTVAVGGGTLVLNSANSFSSLYVTGGTAQISAGTLSLSQIATVPFFVYGPTSVVNITDGAVVNASSTSSIYVAARIDAGGTVTVTGTGSGLATTSLNKGFDVGGSSAGANVLNLTSGGGLTSANYVEVGGYVSGTSGTVNISSGGSVAAPLATVGFTSGTTGAININGSGSVLNVGQILEVGGSPEFNLFGGTGVITVTNGGAINAPYTEFYSNTAIINISGGTLTTAGLYSNSTGNGTMILTDPANGFALNISSSPGDNISYSGSISGTGSLEKTGRGLQALEGNDTFTGAILVTGGVLVIDTPVKISSLVISASSVVVGGVGNILAVPSLTVIAGGQLDIANNSADISAGNLGVITGLAKSGFNNGLWNGPGLASYLAASDSRHLTAVGVIQNNQGGTPIYTAAHQFEGTTPGASDILAKYTYYGDANLDGKVDGTDYSRIDAAYLADKTNPTASTGWFNGDFNYDGMVNGSDYTLIDNAFNTQGAQLSSQIADPSVLIAAQVAGTSSVPEPSILGLLGIAPFGLRLGRDSRRRCKILLD